MQKRTIWRGAALIVVALLCFTADAMADNVKARGTLSSVESDGTVVIDGHGYGLDPSARVFDGQGKSVEPDKLMLPTYVYFEYRFKANSGPVVILIREIPQ